METIKEDIVGDYDFDFNVQRIDGERNRHAVFMSLPDGTSCQLTPPMKYLEAGVFLFGILLAYQVGKAEEFGHQSFEKHESKKAVDFLFFNELKFNLSEMHQKQVLHEIKETFLEDTISAISEFMDKVEDSLSIETYEKSEEH